MNIVMSLVIITYTVLLIAVKWVEMQDVGWVELNYLGNMDRNIDFLQSQRWLLIHQESMDKSDFWPLLLCYQRA